MAVFLGMWLYTNMARRLYVTAMKHRLRHYERRELEKEGRYASQAR